MPSYPIEVEENENVLNASHILNHSESPVSEENLERTFSDNYKLLQLASFLEITRSQSNATDTSICKYFIFTSILLSYKNVFYYIFIEVIVKYFFCIQWMQMTYNW